MDNLSEKIGIFIAGIFLTAFSAVFTALPTMWLRNACLDPAVNGVNTISFWQARGLNFLFSILFKSNVKSNSKNG